MEKYSKYLLKCLKDYGFSYFTVTGLLVDKDGHKIWETPSSPGCKTCCILGGVVNGSSHYPYYFSSKANLFGSAIVFSSNNWTERQTSRLEMSTAEDQCILNLCFLQMMHMLEKTNIYIAGQKIFNKGEAYRYLIEADLNG